MSTLPTTFAERVRERITEQIADLIPKEDLTTLIEARIKEFNLKELPKLIDDCIRQNLSDAIKAEFGKPEYAQTWSQFGGNGASAMVEEMIVSFAPTILAKMIGPAVQQAMYSLQQQRGF